MTEAVNGNDMSTVPPSNLTFRSPWHFPVPDLFSGKAATLGLIAFALLILACSCWKLCSCLGGGRGGQEDRRNSEGDVEAGTGNGGKLAVFDEKIRLVIMAGEVEPTFLATPIPGRSSSSRNAGNGRSCAAEERDKPEEAALEDNAVTQQSL